MLKSKLSPVIPFTSLCLLCLLSLWQVNTLRKLSNAGAVESAHILSNVQLSTLKQMPALGFRNVVADYSFVQFLQYFGDDKVRQNSGYGRSASYLSTTIHHDPYFRIFYLFLSGSTTGYAGQPEKTVEIMRDGLAKVQAKRPSDIYYVWRYKGTDELLYLNDSQSAQKSFEKAAEWALDSNDEDAELAAQASQQTAQFLANNPDSKLAQINAWASVLTTALDNTTRNRAITKIKELGGNVVIGSDGQIEIKYAQAEESSEQDSDI